MKVPLLDLWPQNGPLEEELIEKLREVIRSGRFIMGPKIAAFEEEIAAYCGVPHAVTVSSGTDALLAALMALDVKPGDRVITTPYSFFATVGVIARLGAHPVFADVDPLTYNVSPESLEQAWSGLPPDEQERVKCVMPVHLFGQCADMGRILLFADGRGIPVVEDAAQAIGTQYPMPGGVRMAGSMGVMGCFSFFPSKNLGAFGDAGLITTADDLLAEKLRILRVHGAKPKYYHKVVGGNFRMDPIQAVVLGTKLPHLEEWHAQRRENAARYDRLFAERGLGEFVSTPASLYEGMDLQTPHIYNQYVIRAKNRDALQAHLKSNEIGSEVYYPRPLHLQECFAYLGYTEGSLPHSEKAALETLAIPVYPGIEPAQQEFVVDTIEKFYAQPA